MSKEVLTILVVVSFDCMDAAEMLDRIKEAFKCFEGSNSGSPKSSISGSISGSSGSSGSSGKPELEYQREERKQMTRRLIDQVATVVTEFNWLCETTIKV